MTNPLNRRHFLHDTAALAAAIASLQAGTAGAADAEKEAVDSKKVGPNERLNVACVGVHGRGRDHLDGFTELKDSQVVAICDVDSNVGGKAREQMAKKTGVDVKYVQDVRKLLEDKSIDVVSIATPNHWHALATIWACQAGKDVYVEKPGSHNIFEGRKMVEAAKKYGRIVQHGVQLRSSEAVREAVDHLRKGTIGKVYMARGLVYRRRPSIGHAKDPDTPPKTLDWNLW